MSNYSDFIAMSRSGCRHCSRPSFCCECFSLITLIRHVIFVDQVVRPCDDDSVQGILKFSQTGNLLIYFKTRIDKWVIMAHTHTITYFGLPINQVICSQLLSIVLLA